VDGAGVICGERTVVSRDFARNDGGFFCTHVFRRVFKNSATPFLRLGSSPRRRSGEDDDRVSVRLREKTVRAG
jgi:hypothetical protein